MSTESKNTGNPDSVPSKNSDPKPDALDNLGELPHSYGTDTIFLVAQEPHWVFTYWDIDIALHPGGKTFLRVFVGDKVESEIEVPFETRNWYIPVKEADAGYSVEIGYYRGDQWKAIAKSVTIRTPQEKMSDSGDFDYATIPLHMSFQKLMENIRTTMRDGETLIQALGRLQRDGKLLALDSGGGLAISPDERVVLEALLGKDFLAEISSGKMGAEEMTSKIQARLGEQLHSGGASEVLSKVPWGPAESSLFSALSAIASSTSWSSGALSSWAAAALTSWAAAAQSSWAGKGGELSSAGSESSWGAAALSSWLQAARSSFEQSGESSWGAAALSSWLQAARSSFEQSGESSWGAAALSSWLQAAGSSFEQSGESSWNAAALSSWLQAAGSSWAGEALSSWNHAAMSSWSEAAMSSWSHAETSSWGGSENIGSFGATAREFFMHVNAEVIFYGGTHRDAKVTVDGKPITLGPDGTFRYHFVFPDGNYEIPIIAVSPDGVESRSATLRFERATSRVGDVGHTDQPPLAAPMGGKS